MESPAHSIVTQTPVGWAFASLLVMAVLIAWIRLTGRSPWSRPIVSSLSSLEEGFKLERVLLHCLRRNFLRKWSISNCMFLVFSPWDTWLPLLDWLLLVWVVCILTSRSLLHSRLRNWSWCWDPIDSSQCGPGPTMVGRWTQEYSSISINKANCNGTFWFPSPKMKRTKAQRAQYNEFVESGLDYGFQ